MWICLSTFMKSTFEQSLEIGIVLHNNDYTIILLSQRHLKILTMECTHIFENNTSCITCGYSLYKALFSWLLIKQKMTITKHVIISAMINTNEN